MKTCSKCKEEKPLTDFYKDSSASSGYRSHCKDCLKRYYAGNKEKILSRQEQYRYFNKDKENDRHKLYRLNNPEEVKEEKKRWYVSNRTESLEYGKKWRRDNPEKARALYKKSDAKRLNTSRGKLNRNMARGILTSINQGSKAGRHWESLVAFTADQLMIHLEKLFTPEMTWENQGSYWHIDHRIPKAAFNFETPEDADFMKCWDLQNLQPLEATENMSKGAKLIYA